MFSWCVEESENNSDQTAIVKAKEHSTQVGVFDIVEKLEAELGYLKDTVQSINQPKIEKTWHSWYSMVW